jgi:hypothetical protein
MHTEFKVLRAAGIFGKVTTSVMPDKKKLYDIIIGRKTICFNDLNQKNKKEYKKTKVFIIFNFPLLIPSLSIPKSYPNRCRAEERSAIRWAVWRACVSRRYSTCPFDGGSPLGFELCSGRLNSHSPSGRSREQPESIRSIKFRILYNKTAGPSLKS